MIVLDTDTFTFLWANHPRVAVRADEATAGGGRRDHDRYEGGGPARPFRCVVEGREPGALPVRPAAARPVGTAPGRHAGPFSERRRARALRADQRDEGRQENRPPGPAHR